jgi:dihydrodipicolinate synthase/N-acetylneuraminate lyase
MKRFPPAILATCVVPWDDCGRLLEELFVDQVRRLLRLTPELYIFGTAGEGHAVNGEQFQQVAKLFSDTVREERAEPMVGLISASLSTVVERIEWCRQIGVRRFQLSLPCWGALSDQELFTFFRETCGRFPDCTFLHYNVGRAQRLVAPLEYARLSGEHPNLVATKSTVDSIKGLSNLMWQAPELQHFLTEPYYAYGCQLGQCGLLASISTLSFHACRELFAAGQRRDLEAALTLVRELDELWREFRASLNGETFIDGAYDKLLWRMHDRRFPLRLLPPYASFSEDGFGRFADLLRTKYRRWLPEEMSCR